MKRRASDAAIGRRWLALASLIGTTSCLAANLTSAEPLAGPPRALPVHSALPEDERPSAGPMLLSLPDGFSFDEELSCTSPIGLTPAASPGDQWPKVVPAPWFSLRPTHVPEGYRSGVFQEGLLRVTTLPRIGQADGFGMTDVTKQITLALPPFVKGSPIFFTPSYTMHFLDGPGPIFAPPRLHTIALEVGYRNQLTERWGLDLAVAPSYFGDGTNDDAWRVTGRAIVAWGLTPRLRIVGGALYLGREDYPAVPIGGVAWDPTDDWKLELVVPRPRIYYRYAVDCDVEYRVYLGGEFGGNTWAVERPGGIRDKFTYADLRLVTGWERKATKGIDARVEFGWVFDRSIEYQSGAPGFDPNDTLMVRAEASF